MKKTKITVTGQDVQVDVKKKSSKKSPDAGFNIEEMLTNPKEKDLVDLALIMKDFKKTAAYKYLELRNFNEIKRLIRLGPTGNETAERLLGKLQGLLDQVEGSTKGVIVSGEIAKQSIERKADKESNLEEINFTR